MRRRPPRGLSGVCERKVRAFVAKGALVRFTAQVGKDCPPKGAKAPTAAQRRAQQAFASAARSCKAPQRKERNACVRVALAATSIPRRPLLTAGVNRAAPAAVFAPSGHSSPPLPHGGRPPAEPGGRMDPTPYAGEGFEALARRIAEIPGVTSASVSQSGRYIYVRLDKHNGGKNWNGGVGHRLLLDLSDGALDYDRQASWAGAATRNWHDANDTLGQIRALAEAHLPGSREVERYAAAEAEQQRLTELTRLQMATPAQVSRSVEVDAAMPAAPPPPAPPDPVMPSLSGSEKQIAWANEIRRKTLESLDALAIAKANRYPEDREKIVMHRLWLRERAAMHRESRWWIDQRGDNLRALAREVAAGRPAYLLPLN